MTPAPKLLLAAAVLLVALGVGLAVVQPGGLGGDDEGTQTAQPAVTETETETESEAGSVTETDTATETETATDADGGVDGDAPTTTAATPSTTTPATTTSTTPTTAPATAVGGSGLDGDDGTGAADTEDGLANTGGTSALGVVLALGFAGLALRRRSA